MADAPDLFEAAIRLHQAGRGAEAEQLYRQILQANPGHGGALHRLGMLATQAGRNDVAVEYLARAIAIDPAQAAYHSSLAAAYWALNRLADAEASYHDALRLNPANGAANHNLAMLLHNRGELIAARRHYERAILLRPEAPETHNNLGNVLQDEGDLAAAEASFRQALRLKPDFAEALNNYAKLLDQRGQIVEAIDCYDHALRLKPDFAVAHFNRATLCFRRNQIAEALAGFQEALRIRPNYSSALVNLALVFNEMSRPDDAVECCRKALELGVDTAMLRATMASSLRGQGRGDEAIAWYRRAIEMCPDPAQHSNLLYALNFAPEYDASTIFAEHRAWAAQYAESLTAEANPLAPDTAPERRLRIGYVSPHFREHAVSSFVEPLLAAHDHERFEIICYADNRQADAVTERLKAAADHWRNVHGEPDEQVARRVRDDRIDILVDLAGHIGENRLLLFARRPAPIQVTYLGYQNTTGMSAMDYRLTDAWADPPGLTDRYYTERLVRLPRSFFCYRPSEDAPTITSLPALARGHVTFGSFNHIAKVTSDVVAAWLDILGRVPRSRLRVLANRGGYAEQNLHRRARSCGIDPARIEVFDRAPQAQYLRCLQDVDVALDPFPFNGHTTTCDAIWMGVPVVMLAGQTYASRFGGSVLTNVGLAHLIAPTAQRYVELAVELAGDLAGLAQLRAELRPRIAGSVLLDFQGFTQNLERAYRRMWTDFCRAECQPAETV